MAIWYATTITTSFIDGSTGAYFNDQDHVTGVITAGTWSTWDKSSLTFPNKDRIIKMCPPGEISASIKNTGSSMEGTTEYEVYFATSGNPKKGNKVSQGEIQPIAEGKTALVKSTISKPGNYKFKALQRPGHGNKEDTRHELWSETITVKCTEEKPKAPDKGGDESKPEQPDKKEEPKVTEPDPATDGSKEDIKEVPPPQEEEKQEPEDPAVPAEPESEVEEEQPETTEASVQSSEAPPAKEEEQVEPTPASPDKISNQE